MDARRVGTLNRHVRRLVLAVAVVVVAACSTTGTPSTASGEPSSIVSDEIDGRYRRMVFDDVEVRADIVYDTETGMALDLRTPAGDDATGRPLIVWIHGGWFRGGNRDIPAAIAEDFTRMGYVTASISYRLDPDNLCESVIKGRVTPEEYPQAARNCSSAVDIAFVDAQRSIRWLREHADDYGIDPTRIAVAGLSAGGITAIHVGIMSTGPSDEVNAVVSISGCAFRTDEIDAGDPPTLLIASGFDPEIPFSCVDTTDDLLAEASTPVVRAYYPDEDLHAYFLLEAHRDVLQSAMVDFFTEHLDL